MSLLFLPRTFFFFYSFLCGESTAKLVTSPFECVGSSFIFFSSSTPEKKRTRGYLSLFIPLPTQLLRLINCVLTFFQVQTAYFCPFLPFNWTKFFSFHFFLFHCFLFFIDLPLFSIHFLCLWHSSQVYCFPVQLLAIVDGQLFHSRVHLNSFLSIRSAEPVSSQLFLFLLHPHPLLHLFLLHFLLPLRFLPGQ